MLQIPQNQENLNSRLNHGGGNSCFDNAQVLALTESNSQALGMVPACDLELFARLPEDVRFRIRVLNNQIAEILSSPKITSVCKAIAPTLHISWQRLYSMLVEYREKKDWRVFVNKSKSPQCRKATKPIGLPISLIEFYRMLCEQNQRNSKGGFRALVKIWQTHADYMGKTYDRIPGYPTWPEPEPLTGLPSGWTYGNLQRQANQHPYDLKAARVGLFSASQHRPPVLTSRVGLKLMQYVQMDDHEYNLKVHFPGQSKAMRPRGFNAVDVLTACICAKSFKPTLWDVENETKKALTETDFMWFVVHLLCDVGYRADDVGTTLIIENGTAAIRKEFEDRITSCTQGRVKIARGAMFGDAAHDGQWSVRAKGNFKFKALIESSFNLVDNYFAALPAQVGLNRDRCPADTEGREKYLNSLLNDVALVAGNSQALDVKLPVLTWSQFTQAALRLYQDLNAATEHDVEGWDQCGFTIIEQLYLGKWLPLPPGQSTPFPTRARKLSRQEAWTLCADQKELVVVPPVLYPELMGVQNGREISVSKQNLIEFEDTMAFGPSVMRYIACQNFRPGEKYLCFANPWNPRVLVACKANGAVAGLCEWWDMPCRSDVEAIKRQMGRQAHWQTTRGHALSARHAFETEDRAHMIMHNAAVLEQARDPEPTIEDVNLKEIAQVGLYE